MRKYDGIYCDSSLIGKQWYHVVTGILLILSFTRHSIPLVNGGEVLLSARLFVLVIRVVYTPSYIANEFYHVPLAFMYYNNGLHTALL